MTYPGVERRRRTMKTGKREGTVNLEAQEVTVLLFVTQGAGIDSMKERRGKSHQYFLRYFPVSTRKRRIR